MKRISVIIPSRLARNPVSEDGNLFLDRAVMSVVRQTHKAHEIIIGLDPGATPPGRFSAGLVIVNATKPGQAAACNAAAHAATGELLAFLEDDDQWHPEHLATQLEALDDRYDFASASQRVTDETGNFLRHNDFPTPSGWLLDRQVWDEIGGFDETFRWHVDTDFLGGMGRIVRGAWPCRVHVVEAGTRESPWLANVAQSSAILRTRHTECLVTRCEHPGSGMARIASDQRASIESMGEHHAMFARYGKIPW